MMRTSYFALSLGTVLALTLSSSAQNPSDKPSKPRQPEIYQTDAGQVARPLMAIKAKELIGKKIENEQGEKVGDINDLLIDLPHGRVAGIVVGVGGVLGVGEEPRVVPLQALKFRAGDHPPVLALHGKLRTAKTRTEDLKSYNELSQVYREFQQEAYWDKEPSRQPVRDREAKETQFRLRKGKELIGANVRNPADKTLGEIQDLVVDLNSGRVLFAALGTGGVLGVGEKMIAVPPRQFEMNSEGRLVLNITEERLTNAPQLDKTQWSHVDDPAWVSRVYGYYGETIFWTPGEESRQPVREKDIKNP